MPTPFPTLPPDQRGTVHRLWLHAPCLEGNPWGDPADRELLVYTPPGHGAAGPALPAVLVLPGFAGTGEGLLGRGLGDLPISTRIDRLIGAGCPPFLAVMPDVMTSVGGSQYVDSPGIGAYLTYLLDAVMPEVDARFHTSGAWGAVGRSSGGFGAFNLACADPDRVRAIAFHAGDAGFELCYLGDLPKALRQLSRVGLDGFVERFWAAERPSGDAFSALNILAMSCAYDPVPGSVPYPCRLPLDLARGTVDLDAFRSWARHDPVVRAATPSVREALSRLALIHIDAGVDDEYLLQLGARRLAQTLREGGVQVHHEEHPGGHRGTSWRFDVSLPAVVRALTA